MKAAGKGKEAEEEEKAANCKFFYCIKADGEKERRESEKTRKTIENVLMWKAAREEKKKSPNKKNSTTNSHSYTMLLGIFEPGACSPPFAVAKIIWFKWHEKWGKTWKLLVLDTWSCRWSSKHHRTPARMRCQFIIVVLLFVSFPLVSLYAPRSGFETDEKTTLDPEFGIQNDWNFRLTSSIPLEKHKKGDARRGCVWEWNSAQKRGIIWMVEFHSIKMCWTLVCWWKWNELCVSFIVAASCFWFTLSSAMLSLCDENTKVWAP